MALTPEQQATVDGIRKRTGFGTANANKMADAAAKKYEEQNAKADLEAKQQASRDHRRFGQFDVTNMKAQEFARGFGNSQFRQDQADLAQRLAATGRGENSLAKEQIKQGTERAVSQQLGMAGAQGSANRGMALRQAFRNAGDMQTAAIGQGALAGIQERQQANAALGQVLQGARGTDVEAGLGGLRLGLDSQKAVQEGQLTQDELKTRIQVAQMQADAERAKAKAQLVGSIAGAAGGGLAAGITKWSDRRLKSDISSGGGDSKADEFLDHLEAFSYRYKNPMMGLGEKLGPMAQDLEKSELGEGAVEDTEAGKFVDYGELAAPMAASLGRLNERLRKLEGKKGGK